MVNDDFCDCPDGSDEPGTSACPNGKFHCANNGHKAIDVPSSRVNDKICDCCDGSDEWGSGVQCQNICNELGKAAREEKERQAVVARAGWVKRQEMVQKGKQMKAEKEALLAPAHSEIERLNPEKTIIEQRKKEAEDKENASKDAYRQEWEIERNEKKKVKAEVLFKTIDINKDGKITLDDIKSNLLFDSNKDGNVDDDEAKIYLNNTEEIDLEHFFTQMYDSLHLLIKQRDEEKIEEEQETLQDDLIADEDKEHVEHPHEKESDEDFDQMPAYPAEIQQLIDEAQRIRDEYNDIERKISEYSGQIRDVEQFLVQDFGKDSVWAALKGQCFELNDMQYTYKLCPFEKAMQKDKNGYSETSLGTWGSWTGAEPHKYSAQKYEKGQQCWNGPERSTDVVIECGEENELVSTSEPAKCEYKFVFRSPAACVNPDEEEPVHTEL